MDKFKKPKFENETCTNYGFLPAATLGAVRSTGAKVWWWCPFVRPLLVQPYIISTCMVFCGYLDIWTADVNFGKMII